MVVASHLQSPIQEYSELYSGKSSPDLSMINQLIQFPNERMAEEVNLNTNYDNSRGDTECEFTNSINSYSDSNIDYITFTNNNDNDNDDNTLNAFNSTNNNRFPSPPLSPKLNISKENVSPNHSNSNKKPICNLKNYDDDKESIIVKACWDKSQNLKRYRIGLEDFVQNYRFFNNKSSTRYNNRNNNNDGIDSNNNSNSHNSTRYQNYYNLRTNNNNINYDINQLRKSLLKKQYQQEYGTSSNSRSTTPYHRKYQRHGHYYKHKTTTSSSSYSQPSIASISMIKDAPQYVPNISWKKLPDYSPSPNDTLSKGNNKCLKIEWKGSPLNLSNDPLYDELHPAELLLASILRLPCDLYLDSKRRLFLEKFCKLKLGLPFRRTDAQKACRIDVNKASRLYAAFEKVGWLDDDQFNKFL